MSMVLFYAVNQYYRFRANASKNRVFEGLTCTGVYAKCYYFDWSLLVLTHGVLLYILLGSDEKKGVNLNI